MLLALACSGAASLLYQVCWTRRLADVTSATSRAQAVVLAVFFLGLALGAVYAGRVARKLARPLWGYAAVELGALVAALVSLPAFGLCERVRAAAAHAGASPALALGAALTCAGVLLLVPTTLLGASLPFAIEASERSSRRRVVGTFYGINTLGAAAGAALGGFVLIERVGLARTISVGAALSLLAALLGLGLGRVPGGEATGLAEPERLETQPKMRGLLGAAALAGFVGVGAEIVWTRLLSRVVLNTVYAFTQVLIAVLIGIALGAWLAERIVARAGGSRAALLRAAAVLQVAAAVAMACVAPLCLLLAGRTELEAEIAAGRSLLGGLGLVLALAVPVTFNAATLPLLVYAAGNRQSSRSFGALYGANTAGSIASSLLVGFVLLPRLGSQGASAVLEGASLLLAVGLLWTVVARKQEALAALGPGVVTALLHVLFPDQARQVYEARIPEKTRILELREGLASDVMVTQAEDSGRRRIWINSSWVAGTGGGHRALGHLPALFVAAPRRALGIALGTGQTFAAVFANGVQQLDVVEINPDVIALSRRWFGEANGGLFERAGVRVHQDDGRVFLRSTSERFDLIVLEPLQAWSAGTSSLYSREFYREAQARLAPGGLMAQWIPLYGQGVDDTRAMVKTAIETFPSASLWLDERDGILLLRREATRLEPEAIAGRIAERGLSLDLERKALSEPLDLLALLVLGPRGLRRWTSGAQVITDDRPFLEFAAARQLGANVFAPLLRSISAARGSTGVEAQAVAGDSALVIQADQVSRALVSEASLAPSAFEPRALVLEAALALAPTSGLLRRRYRGVMEGWGSAAVQQRVAPQELERILRRGLEHDPDQGEAALNLAVLAFRKRDEAAARKWLEAARKVERTRPSAEQLLVQLKPF